jgi:hypothetical protein
MALTWDARECKDLQAIGIGKDADRLEWSKTEHMIFMTLISGFPGKTWAITEDNVEDMFLRFSAYEHVADSRIRVMNSGSVHALNPGAKTFEDVPLTREDVRARIGLRTNAGTVTAAAFERKLGQIALRRAKERK